MIFAESSGSKSGGAFILVTAGIVFSKSVFPEEVSILKLISRNLDVLRKNSLSDTNKPVKKIISEQGTGQYEGRRRSL